MPWRTQTVMDERAQFAVEASRSIRSFAETCRRFGISRPTGHKWRKRIVYVSRLLSRELVALEPIADGVSSVYFGPVHLGWLDERDFRIMDVRRLQQQQR